MTLSVADAMVSPQRRLRIRAGRTRRRNEARTDFLLQQFQNSIVRPAKTPMEIILEHSVCTYSDDHHRLSKRIRKIDSVTCLSRLAITSSSSTADSSSSSFGGSRTPTKNSRIISPIVQQITTTTKSSGITCVSNDVYFDEGSCWEFDFDEIALF